MTITTHRWQAADIASWRVELGEDNQLFVYSPTVSITSDCTEIIPSWGASTPPGTAIELRLRIRRGADWSKWYRIALWDSAPIASRRTSFDRQEDDDGYVATDTLVIRPGADAVEALVVGHGGPPQLRTLTLTCSGAVADALPDASAIAPCRIETPCFSQFSYASEDGWCSPTALAMVLGYWHERTGQPALAPFVDPNAVPELVAKGVYDPVYGGYGNWSMNVAFVAQLGLESYVARMDQISAIEPWLAAGVPVVMSISWREGQLTGAPLPRSNGHLVVATGITPTGDILVADPAGATAADVRRCYRRAELESCWLRPHGTVYLIYPVGYH